MGRQEDSKEKKHERVGELKRKEAIAVGKQGSEEARELDGMEERRRQETLGSKKKEGRKEGRKENGNGRKELWKEGRTCKEKKNEKTDVILRKRKGRKVL